MQQLKLLLVLSLIIGCLAEDMKKHQSNSTKTDQKPTDPKMPLNSKMMKDAKQEDAKMRAADQKAMESKMMDPKMMDSKMMDSKMMDTNMMDTKMTHGHEKDVVQTNPMAGAAKDAGPAKEDQMKSKEDMQVEATVGLGFYGGVVPISYGYSGYGGYGGYGYPSHPYYRSYYPRPYYGYSYRPIIPVIVKPRPVPLLLG